MKENVLNAYISSAEELIKVYIQNASVKFIPLHLFLKQYFKQHGKFGKRDRNAITDLVYSFFRCGHSFPSTKIRERILLGSYLCYNNESSVYHHLVQQQLKSELPDSDYTNRIETAKTLFPGFEPMSFLPFEIKFSEGISLQQYFISFLKKPATFIRVIPPFGNKIISELQDAGITWEQLSEGTFKIASSRNLTALNAWEKGWFEIQDLSSQQTVNFMHPKKGDKWWDVCAASGGKSLLLLSKEKDIYIFASDIRANILQNYTERLKKHGFLNFKTSVINSAESFELNETFNGIICDVPCSGSGTWHRTPENLFFFKQDDLEKYSQLQEKILRNAIARKTSGTAFLYITCSVFEQENERVLEPYQTVSSQIINNLDKEADAMFISEL